MVRVDLRFQRETTPESNLSHFNLGWREGVVTSRLETEVESKFETHPDTSSRILESAAISATVLLLP